MTAPRDLAKAARAREGQQDAALEYQRQVGRIIAQTHASGRFSPADVAAALQAAGLTPSRGGIWTPQVLQGIRARIRARCVSDPEFTAEVASWSPPAQPIRTAAQASFETMQAEAQRRREDTWAAEIAELHAAKAAIRADRQHQWDEAQEMRLAAREARAEVKQLVRTARRSCKSAAEVAADVRRTTLGTEAARLAAEAARQGAWVVAGPLLRSGMTLAQVAAEMNRMDVPRLRGSAQEWSKAAVSQLRSKFFLPV